GFFLFFFLQAGDGIRGRNVTGVQACALPIRRRTHGTGDPHTSQRVGHADPERSHRVTASYGGTYEVGDITHGPGAEVTDEVTRLRAQRDGQEILHEHRRDRPGGGGVAHAHHHASVVPGGYTDRKYGATVRDPTDRADDGERKEQGHGDQQDADTHEFQLADHESCCKGEPAEDQHAHTSCGEGSSRTHGPSLGVGTENQGEERHRAPAAPWGSLRPGNREPCDDLGDDLFGGEPFHLCLGAGQQTVCEHRHGQDLDVVGHHVVASVQGGVGTGRTHQVQGRTWRGTQGQLGAGSGGVDQVDDVAPYPGGHVNGPYLVDQGTDLCGVGGGLQRLE